MQDLMNQVRALVATLDPISKRRMSDLAAALIVLCGVIVDEARKARVRDGD